MKQLSCVVAGLGGAMLLGLAGCNNHYSDKIKYGVRTDPLVMPDNKFKKLTTHKDEKWANPDRPGQLPLLSRKDVEDDRNPLYYEKDPTGKRLFEDEGILLDMAKINAAHRDMLDHALVVLFGTPAEPKVQLDNDTVSTLQVEMPTLKEGSRLYRIHCLHCHGVSGDGRGPTARWINPHPRDFRQSIFKFQTVNQVGDSDRPPHRTDLYRTLHQGLEGTAMPAFGVLPKEELNSLASYVIHLSLRGRAEYDTLAQQFELDKDKTWLVYKKSATITDKAQLQDAIFKDAAKIAQHYGQRWVKSQAAGALIAVDGEPEDTDEEKFRSRLRGKLLFNGVTGPEKGTFRGKPIDPVSIKPEEAKAANCVQCHTDYGRRALFSWDEWGTQVRPRNFTEGFFRGGRRPVDIYARIHSGINGSGMNAFADLGNKNIWDLVRFVQALGYEKMRLEMGVD